MVIGVLTLVMITTSMICNLVTRHQHLKPNDYTNPRYWENITKVYKVQLAKGLAEYGKPIEEDEMDMTTRIIAIEEELVDALLYLEHLRAMIK